MDQLNQVITEEPRNGQQQRLEMAIDQAMIKMCCFVSKLIKY